MTRRRTGILAGIALVGLVALALYAAERTTPADPLAMLQDACNARLHGARPELVAGPWKIISGTTDHVRARARVQPADAGPKNRIGATAECTIGTGAPVVILPDR